MSAPQRIRMSPWSAIGPGILVAATGVGAGDLATASLAGAVLGTGVLWAVVAGAAMKFVLNEGLTRWQLVTGTTLLEGSVRHLHRGVQWGFVLYLAVWSYLVAMALMSACGVTAHALLPVFDDAAHGKIAFGILHSLVAIALITAGGYRLFERVMQVCIAVMVIVVCPTAWMLGPDWGELLRGLCVPTIPKLSDGGLEWTIALCGGVGGTVTILCYGYWIREEGRSGPEMLGGCRLDLGIGYAMTALFGLAMVVIGAQLGDLGATGANLIVRIAETLESRMATWGPAFKWAFLFGAWSAVFSSLLGVWQSVPYLFVDYGNLLRARRSGQGDGTPRDERPIDTRGAAYRGYLLALAILPITGLFWFDFRYAMKVNGIVGAIFIPILAGALLLLCGSERLMGPRYKNSIATNLLLIAALVLFLIAGGFQIAESLATPEPPS